jgi:hypothetical protein
MHFQYIDKIINISDKDSFAARNYKRRRNFLWRSTGTIVHVVLKKHCRKMMLLFSLFAIQRKISFQSPQ